jgi:integrase
MPSLIERGRSGFYLQFYDASRSPNRRQVSLRTTDPGEARRRMHRLIGEHAADEFDPWLDGTPFQKEKQPRLLSEALEAFLDLKRAEGLADRTLIDYQSFVGRCIRHVGDRPLESLPGEILSGWIWSGEVAGATRLTRYRHLAAFLNRAVREGWIEESPLDGEPVPRRGDRIPKTMYREDLEAICAAVRRDWRHKRSEGLCARGEVIWRAWAFRFGFYTGLRGSEIGRLEWGHIDAERRLLYILRQKNRKQQTIPLAGAAIGVLAETQRHPRCTYVFGGPQRKGGTRNAQSFRNNLSRSFRKYRDIAGIDRPITLHSLRHGFCTALAEAGKPATVIKQLARHQSITTSMLYVNLSQAHLQSEIDNVF